MWGKSLCVATILGVGGGLTVVSAEQFSAARAAAAVARIPPRILSQLPQQTIAAVLDGELPIKNLMASLALIPPSPAPAPRPLDQLQPITHWVSHWNTLPGTIADDLVNEATLDGRCSGQQMASGAMAPYGYPSYFFNDDGTVSTSSGQAPFNSQDCSYSSANLTRYFVTWVKSPTARSAYIFFGSSDDHKLWLNHTLVSSRTAGIIAPYVPDQYHVKVSLLAGWNLIVVKQSFPQLGPFTDPDPLNQLKEFRLRFCADGDGTPILDLVAAFDPMCTDADSGSGSDSRAVLPLLAHLNGKLGSIWRGDAMTYNGTHMRWWHRVRFYQAGNNSGIPDADTTLELNPYESRTLEDVLPSFMNFQAAQKGYGWVFGQLEDYVVNLGWWREKVFNQSGTGTFGMGIPALAELPAQAVHANYLPDVGHPLQFTNVRSGAYRVNLALFPLVNAGATATVRVTLSGPDIGADVSGDFPLTGFTQIDDIFAMLGKGGVFTNNTMVTVELAAPWGTWVPFITVNDGNPANGLNGTSDPGFFLGTQRLL
jgi:hypothetical protein